ncbi:hypothetical protein ACFLYO_05605, partial [Chloroflexota bacterium]
LKDIDVKAIIDFSGDSKGIADLFATWGEKTVSWLFTNKKKGDASKVRNMALGSMLHMLQDTFCASHAQRVAGKRENETAKKIKGFNVYTEQSAKLIGDNRYGTADKLKNGKVNETAGAKEAAAIGAKVLLHYKKNADWTGIVKPFLEDVFALTPELEQQKPEHHTGENRQSEEGGRRLTTTSGRQIRKKWLSDKFKKDSKVRFKKRPKDLQRLDAYLKIYEDYLKVYELDTLTTNKDYKTRLVELRSELDTLERALNYAEALKMASDLMKRNKSEEKRHIALVDLIKELKVDRKEIQLDITSIPQDQQEL